MATEAYRYGVFWTLHDTDGQAIPESGQAERSKESCRPCSVHDRPTLGSMQAAPAVEWRPELNEPFVVVAVQRSGHPGLASCRRLGEAEQLAKKPRRSA